MKKALVFFDINGTLIKRDQRTDLPFTYAVDTLFECVGLMEGVNTSARSDKDVFIEILEKVQKPFEEALWQTFMAHYLVQLEKFKTTDVWRENVDAVSYVQKLSRAGYDLSLITGELKVGAEYKLSKLEIWQYFPTGGFGEDGLMRFQIAEAALSKAQALYGKNHEKIVIIGDTLLDIQTARHIGAHVISIATGSNTREELTAANPDELVERFSEVRSLG